MTSDLRRACIGLPGWPDLRRGAGAGGKPTPELQDMVAELQAVSQALNVDVPPADELLRGRQIGAALDAFDALRGEPDEREATATIERTRPAPVDLAERRSTRQAPARSRNGLPPWLGIAAVLLLIVGGVGLLTQLDGDDDDAAETAADSFDDSDDGERGSDDEATEEVAVADEERATEAPAAAESAQDPTGRRRRRGRRGSVGRGRERGRGTRPRVMAPAPTRRRRPRRSRRPPRSAVSSPRSRSTRPG